MGESIRLYDQARAQRGEVNDEWPNRMLPPETYAELAPSERFPQSKFRPCWILSHRPSTVDLSSVGIRHIRQIRRSERLVEGLTEIQLSPSDPSSPTLLDSSAARRKSPDAPRGPCGPRKRLVIFLALTGAGLGERVSGSSRAHEVVLNRCDTCCGISRVTADHAFPRVYVVGITGERP